MHYADNRPFQLEERWINVEATPEVENADLGTSGPHEWLLNAAPFADVDVTICAISADSRLSEFLGTTTGAAMIQLERTTWLHGLPISFARLTHLPGYCIKTKY